VNYLQKYQQQLGLVPDGIIGKKTAAAMMEDLGVSKKLLFAHAMGQAMHESGLWTNFRENMNYGEAGLLNIFEKYYKPFPAKNGHPSLASLHSHKPQKIANYVYANRNGNGDEDSGDGYFYRGIFGLQLTGRANIVPFLVSIGLPPDTDPDTLRDDPKAYFQAIFYWFKHNDAEKLCTSPTRACIDKVGKKVNRGNILPDTKLALNNGERREYTLKILNSLGLA
jgi:putative chitinase